MTRQQNAYKPRLLNRNPTRNQLPARVWRRRLPNKHNYYRRDQNKKPATDFHKYRAYVRRGPLLEIAQTGDKVPHADGLGSGAGPFSRRNSQARATCRSRSTVALDIRRTSEASSAVQPRKYRNSISRTLRSSTVASSSRA